MCIKFIDLDILCNAREKNPERGVKTSMFHRTKAGIRFYNWQ